MNYNVLNGAPNCKSHQGIDYKKCQWKWNPEVGCLLESQLSPVTCLNESQWHKKQQQRKNLEFWQTFDGLKRPEHTENPQWLDSAYVFAFGPPVESKHS